MTDKNYRQRFKGPIEGFVVNYIQKHLWRVNRLVDVDDLMVDAQRLYFECFDRYITKGRVDNPKWFMALFKVSFINYFNAISNEVTKQKGIRNFTELSNEDSDFSLDDYIKGFDSNWGELIIKVAESPPEVKEVLAVLLEMPLEDVLALDKEWKDTGKRNVDGNEYICSLLGKDHKQINLVQEVKNYFLT